jgi:hypothetical protein
MFLTGYECKKKNNAWHPLQTSLGSGLWNMDFEEGKWGQNIVVKTTHEFSGISVRNNVKGSSTKENVW